MFHKWRYAAREPSEGGLCNDAHFFPLPHCNLQVHSFVSIFLLDVVGGGSTEEAAASWAFARSDQEKPVGGNRPVHYCWRCAQVSCVRAAQEEVCGLLQVSIRM